MNRSNYETRNMKITTIGAVHIGSGKEISKIECWRKKDGKIDIMDMEEVIKKIYEGKSFDKNIEKCNNFTELINEYDYEQFCDCKRYEIEMKIEKDANIGAFIKCNGEPYMPGSSIKGAIRTAIMAKQMKEKVKKEEIRKEKVKEIETIIKEIEKIKEIKKKIKKKIKEIEKIKEIKKEIKKKIKEIKKEIKEIKKSIDKKIEIDKFMKYIIIRDGVIKTENRGSCLSVYKIENKVKKSEIPIFKECIKPQTVIETDIIVDTNVNGKGNTASTAKIFDMIEESIKYFYEEYKKYYNVKDEGKKEIIYLGGHTGFVSKTVLCQILDLIFEDDKIKNEGRNIMIYDKYVEIENTPKMIKKAERLDIEMGKCMIEIGEK